MSGTLIAGESVPKYLNIIEKYAESCSRVKERPAADNRPVNLVFFGYGANHNL